MKLKIEINHAEVEKTLVKAAGVLPESIIRLADDIKKDIDAICQRDPAVKSRAEAALLYSGLHAILAYRVSNKFYKKKMYTTARFISQAARLWMI